MTHAAEEMASYARRFPHMRPAAERMRQRAAAMQEGVTVEELAAAGDRTLYAILGTEAA